ncbi:hypothetical protein GCM10010145_00310 [Streptomyces ruber]|uniref:Uncharacterized protein n=2 Tax=Streptomyces TaxID=1883 RepID=A0A918B6D9_9ACTN|nr:hypothetical protein GCM10010145_00310 [Streptomyces ruber]
MIRPVAAEPSARLSPTSRRNPDPRRVSWGPAPCTWRHRYTRSIEEHPVEIFFEVLLVLVAVGVLAFTGLAVKKLYQGQL